MKPARQQAPAAPLAWTDVANIVESLQPGGEVVLELDGPVRIFFVKVSDDGETVTFGLDQKVTTRRMTAGFFADVLRRAARAALLQ